MTAKELRAMTAQGPAVVMVAKEDMLRLLDEAATRKRLLWAYRIAFAILTVTALTVTAALDLVTTKYLLKWMLA